jgi:hypothetical protein
MRMNRQNLIQNALFCSVNEYPRCLLGLTVTANVLFAGVGFDELYRTYRCYPAKIGIGGL